MSGKLMEKLNYFIEKLNQSVIIKSLMGGMMVSMPAIMAGSIATILMNLYSLFFDRRIAQCCHYKIIELGNRRNITTFVG